MPKKRSATEAVGAVPCLECGSVPSVAPVVGGRYRVRCHCPKVMGGRSVVKLVQKWNKSNKLQG